MTDLIRYKNDLQPSRIERQSSRAVERIQARQSVTAAREAAKVEVVAEVTEAALLATSHISALESLLVTRTPRAEERLRHIADAGSFSLVEIVLGTARRCR